jgi:hypothetical protein
MDQHTREAFGRQLACWAESALSQERLPFRRIEAFPSLLTEEGVCRPPLVVWINRDSLMAGGVVLIPRRDPQEEIESGRRCAQALGLRHFVTWAPREIVFWETRDGEAMRLKALPLAVADGNVTAALQQSLLAMLEELKLLSVMGAVPPAEHSAHYLANLCRNTLLDVLPAIEAAARAARSDSLLGKEAPLPESARRKGLLTLLRLLGLAVHGLLPPAVRPEGLERAMDFALDRLPPHLRPPLRAAAGELPLPPEAGVRYHHLLRRLTQLQCGADRPRAARVLELLLETEVARLGGAPLPWALEEAQGPTLLIHPDRLYPEVIDVAEVAAPDVLAATALIRDLRGLPPARAQATDPFTLTLPAPPGAILGTLSDLSTPNRVQRRALTARLRAAWPSRRFALPPRTPVWLYELLHLLGLSAQGAKIVLALPDICWEEEFAATLAELLKEEFLLEALAAEPGGGCRLRLTRERSPEQTACRLSLARLAQAGPPAARRSARVQPPRAPRPEAQQIERIASAVFIDGVPRFPEHYLYGARREELVEYAFTPPLTVGESFLGRVTLHDAGGVSWEVEGAETAQALLLAAGSGSPVLLPLERARTAAILDRYLTDLRALRRELRRQCHRLLADARAADVLADRLWAERRLPPAALLESEPPVK